VTNFEKFDSHSKWWLNWLYCI